MKKHLVGTFKALERNNSKHLMPKLIRQIYNCLIYGEMLKRHRYHFMKKARKNKKRMIIVRMRNRPLGGYEVSLVDKKI